MSSQVINEIHKDINDMVRNPKKKHDKFSEKYFLLIIAVFICLVYYVFTYEFIWISLTRNRFNIMLAKNVTSSITMIVVLNLLLFIVLWCLIVTMFTLPGEIPQYWVIIIHYLKI